MSFSKPARCAGIESPTAGLNVSLGLNAEKGNNSKFCEPQATLVEAVSLWPTTFSVLYDSIKNWLDTLLDSVLEPGSASLVIIELVHLILNLITSGTLLWKNQNGFITTLAGISFFSNFALVFKKLGNYFRDLDVDKAIQFFLSQIEIMRLQEINTVQPNSEQITEDNWITNIGLILTAFFSSIIVGIGYCTSGLKGISEGFRLASFSKTGVEAIKQTIEKLLSMIVHKNTDPILPEKEAVLSLVEQSQVMLRRSIGDLASNNFEREKLRKLIKEVNYGLTIYKHNETSTLRSLLSTLVRDLNKKLEEIEHIIPSRQVTTGVMLQGNKGVGKSTLANFLAKSISERYGWRSNMYSVSPGVKFYEPYLNEDFGIVNEFASTTDRDTFVADANRICSSDPFNFESASLNGKLGSCQLKMLFVTTNSLTPEIPELTQQAIPAFWDRFIIVEVKDKMVKSRRQIHSHRKEDFSHLEFDIKEVIGEENKTLQFTTIFQSIKIGDLLEILQVKLSLETIAYHKRIEVELPSQYCDTIMNDSRAVEGSYAYKYFGFEQTILANQGGRNFCILRLQGVEGTGKTSQARTLAKRWLHITRRFEEQSDYIIQESHSIDEFIPQIHSCVYILDDWVSLNMSDKECKEYVMKMNSTANDSIFIITTNETIKRKTFLGDVRGRLWSAIWGTEHRYPYDLESFEERYSGVYRRLGLDDSYVRKNKLFNINSLEYCTTINVDARGCMSLNNTNVGTNKLLEQLKLKYIAMQKDRFNITVINDKPEQELSEVDLLLVVENEDLLFKKLKNGIGAASLYLSPNDKAGLYVSDRILAGVTQMGKAVKPSDFICDEIFSEEVPSKDRYITIVTRIMRVLLQYYKEPTFKILIKDKCVTIYSDSSIVYYYEDNTEKVITFENATATIHIGRPITISAEQFANSLCVGKIDKKFEGPLENMTCDEYNLLEQTYRKHLYLKNFNTFITEVLKLETKFKHLQSEKYIETMATAKKNKLLLIALCGFVGIGSIGAGYGLYKLISNFLQQFSREEVVSNAFANVGSTPPKKTQDISKEHAKIDLGVNVTEPVISNSPYTKGKAKIFTNNVEANSEYRKNKSKIFNNSQEEQNQTINMSPHEHICKACGCLYSHVHNFNKNFIHPQHDHHCPNEGCAQYHNGSNPKRAILIQKDFLRTELEPLTPNAMTKLMGDDMLPARTALLAFFAKLPEAQRLQVYDEIRLAREGNDRTFKRLCKKHPGLYDCIESVIEVNMLCESDMIEVDESDLERLHRKLNRSYCMLTYAGFKAYALHVGNGFFITVSHCFDEVDQELTLTSEGVIYPARVVSILRERDIAVLVCHPLQNLPSAKRYFVENSDRLSIEGYFMRCGPTMSVASGALEYKEYQEFLDGQCPSENYRPCMEVLKIRRFGMLVKEIIKKGDCGFPFLTKIDGSMRIVGIHNAYKIESVVYGAFISQSLITEMCNIVVPNSEVYMPCTVVRIPIRTRENEEQPETIEMSMPVEYTIAFNEAIKPDPYLPENSHLSSVGYNMKFKNWNKLQEKHHTHDIKLENINTSLPAAYNLNYVTDTSELVLDGMKRPSPLWTQAHKYQLIETKYDEHIMEHAIEMCYDYNKLTYAEKPFRLLTEFEAINGMREPYLSNLDIKTSAGPYAKYFWHKLTKREIFKVTNNNNSPLYSFNEQPVSQNIRNHLKSQRHLLEKYCIPPCLISQDNAKVENIGTDKARKGKVRLFNNVDISINAILKIYFGNWFAQCMDKYETGYYAIGQDPYRTSTAIWHRFSTKQGKILNTDFSAFDKLLIPKLIQAFCKIAYRLTENKKHSNELESIYEALSKTLTHAIHILDGSVYIVHNGNESGTFVTTLLNCVAVHIIFNYSFIKCWYKIPKYMYIQPSLRDIMARSEIAILGDDKTQIVSDDIPMTEEDLIIIASELGMKCTSSKGDEHRSDQIDFCSRVFNWNEKDQIVYPQLKKESIIGLLYWFASFEKNQIRDNMMIALFEASLHNKNFFESILRDVLVLAKEMNIDPRTIPFTNFEQSRRRLRTMVMNDIEYEQISALANRGTNLLYENEDIALLLKQSTLNDTNKIIKSEIGIIKDPPLNQTKTVGCNGCKHDTNEEKMERYSSSNDNPISKCFELLSKLEKQPPSEHYEKSGPAHSPIYTCTLDFEGRKFGGEGPSKASSKTQAYGALAVYLQDHIIPNAVDKDQVIQAEIIIQKISQRAFSLFIEKHLKVAKQRADGKRYVKLVASGYTRRHLENHDGFDCFYDSGARYVLSDIISQLSKADTAACYLRYPGITWNPVTREITLDVHESTSKWTLRNIDGKDYHDDETLEHTTSTITPNSSDEKPMLGVIQNDDPVKMPETGVMLSDKEIYHPIIMNRSAPSNSWMQAGGVTFNIYDLAYNQFVFANEQLKIGTQARGKIIAQIPYCVVNNKYVNDYIQNLALLHNRMTGDWMLKLSCPGVFGLQCSVMVSWYPKKMSENNIADMAELSKYAFFTNSLSVPWSQTIVVTDARQYQFYRDIPHSNTSTPSIEEQPHIILSIETPSTPSFKDEVPAYITFASKLCSEKDLMFNPAIKPFILADPCKAITQDGERGYKLNF